MQQLGLVGVSFRGRYAQGSSSYAASRGPSVPGGGDSLASVDAEFAGIHTDLTNQANTRYLIRVGRLGELNYSVPRGPDLRQQLPVAMLAKN